MRVSHYTMETSSQEGLPFRLRQEQEKKDQLG